MDEEQMKGSGSWGQRVLHWPLNLPDLTGVLACDRHSDHCLKKEKGAGGGGEGRSLPEGLDHWVQESELELVYSRWQDY